MARTAEEERRVCKERMARYRATPEGLTKTKLVSKKFWASEKGRAAVARRVAAIKASPERMAARRAYEITPEYKAARKRRYSSPEGKAVQLRNHLLREYRLTLAQYEAMLARQKGVCAICSGADKNRRLSVDHDHVTKKVRALLCTPCNRMLGFARDNSLILTKAMHYIDAFSEGVDTYGDPQ